MKRLPIDVSSFPAMITNNYVYVDKTRYIYDLINETTGSRYFFLSRPRRFGKSLLISTLEELFKANKKLFEGLWIASSDYTWQKYPIIKIDFSTIDYKNPDDLDLSLRLKLDQIAKTYDIDVASQPLLKSKFAYLIEQLAKKNKVVVLIDEYDKPILDHINNVELAESIRNVLSEFYGTLKGVDNYLRAIFITGVTKFSKTSIFSGINNINDISIKPESAELLGYTFDEINKYFYQYVSNISPEKPLTVILGNLQRWYNGYRFSDKDSKVYNPFSVLYCLQDKQFRNYWFGSGTPSFLIELLKTQYKTLENLQMSELSPDSLEYFQITRIPLVPLLYQTGYLTIIHYDQASDKFNLAFPNFEVENSFKKYLIAVLSNGSSIEVEDARPKLIKALRANNLADFCNVLQSLFSHIPYTLHIKKESYYHSLFQFLMSFLSLEAQSEQLTNQGRIDMSISLDNTVYIFELKLNSDPSKALAQIHQKKYYERFVSSGKKIILVGLSFDIEHETLEIKHVCQEL